MVGHFWGVPPWVVEAAPLHYVEEARIILRAQYEAKAELVKRKMEPILPDF